MVAWLGRAVETGSGNEKIGYVTPIPIREETPALPAKRREVP